MSGLPNAARVRSVGQIKSTMTGATSCLEITLAISPSLRACSILSSIVKPRSELMVALTSSALR